VTYQNALDAYGQSGRFNEEDWLNSDPIDQTQTFSGNTILRGGHRPLTEEDLDNSGTEDDLIIE
jgi:hypothetical protein